MSTLQERARSRRGSHPAVEVVFFTDPYSTWCWASEPVWLRLRENYGHEVGFRTVMGGLVEKDVLDVQRVAWLRQHMADVAARSGQPIDPAVLDDSSKPFSTWPACIHIKAAQQQGEDLAQRYLRRMRIAIMTEARHGSEPPVAEDLTQDVEGMDTTGWRGALADGSALQAFLDDQSTCRQRGVQGFPAFLIRLSSPGRRPRALVGYRPFAQIEAALTSMAPWLSPRPARPAIDLLFDLGPLTTREVQEIQGLSPRETVDLLDGLAEAGTVHATRRAGGTFWSLGE